MRRMSLVHVSCMTVFFTFASVVQSFCQQPTVLRFMWWGTDSRHKATLTAIDMFQKKYPNIKVKAEYSGLTGYNEKLTTDFMGKNAADLLQVNWNMLYMLGSDNYYDLSKAGVNLGDYPKDLVEQCTIDGKVIGVPLSTNGRLFYFQKTIFEKAGLGIPQSFADLIADAPVMKKKMGKEYYPLYLGDYDSWLISLLYCEQKFGKPFIIKDKVAYTADQLKIGLDWYVSLIQKGVVPSIAETQNAGIVPFDQDQRWITGKYAGLFEWSASADKVKSSVSSGVVVPVTTPKDYGPKPGTIYKISMTYAIYGKSKHPKEAALLINFLLSDPEAVKVQGLQRGVPLNKNGAEALKNAGKLAGFEYDAQLASDKGAGMGINPRFEDPELQKYYREEVMQQIAKIGTKAAAEKAIKKTNAYLKEAASE